MTMDTPKYDLIFCQSFQLQKGTREHKDQELIIGSWNFINTNIHKYRNSHKYSQIVQMLM